LIRGYWRIFNRFSAAVSTVWAKKSNILVSAPYNQVELLLAHLLGINPQKIDWMMIQIKTNIIRMMLTAISTPTSPNATGSAIATVMTSRKINKYQHSFVWHIRDNPLSDGTN
jgi:hypothetical protein